MFTSNGVAGHADVITLLYTMKKTPVLDILAVWRSHPLGQLMWLSACMGFLRTSTLLLLESLTFGNTLQ